MERTLSITLTQEEAELMVRALVKEQRVDHPKRYEIGDLIEILRLELAEEMFYAQEEAEV
jgi:hypothetical protein